MRVCISAVAIAIVLLTAVACGSTSTPAHRQPAALLPPGATAPISTAPGELVTLPDIQLSHIGHPETAWQDAGGCAADGCSASGQVVWLEPGATLGMVFLGPPSDAYVVLSNPTANAASGSVPLAAPGKVVFDPTDPMDAAGSEDVRLKLQLLVTDASGLYLYDELGDPVCPLVSHIRLAVLTTDSRMGSLVQIVDENGVAVGNRGWLPVNRVGSTFVVLKPPVSLPSGQGC